VEAQRKFLEFVFRWNFDLDIAHERVSDILKGFYDLEIIEETNQILCLLELDLVNLDHLSVFTFADTKERFGFEKLISGGVKELSVMALNSLDSLSSAPYPVKTKDEKRLVIELVSKFTDGGKWDVHGITDHWNMLYELIQIGKESPRNITPKHHSHIAQYLKSIEDQFIRYATTSVLRDEVKDLQKILRKPVVATPKVMAVSKRSESLAFNDAGELS
jgi:hypothetical protein